MAVKDLRSQREPGLGSYLKVVTGLTPAEFLLLSPSPLSLAAFSLVCSSSRHLISSNAAYKTHNKQLIVVPGSVTQVGDCRDVYVTL